MAYEEHKKVRLETLKKIAEKYGGKLLSKEYVNNYTPLTWTCNKGHKWKSKATNAINGHWCPQCHWESMKKKK